MSEEPNKDDNVHKVNLRQTFINMELQHIWYSTLFRKQV